MSLTRAERQRLLAIASGRSAEPLRLLEGPKAVLDALQTGAVAELWMRDDLQDERGQALRAAALRGRIPLREASPREFERLGSTVTPQGVLALVRDVAVPAATILADARLVVWLDGVQDPGNVGAIVRVAAAFGAAGVLVSDGGGDPLGLKALRASAGLALRVPLARGPAEALADACRHAERTLCVLERGGEDLRTLLDPLSRLVLVVGSEGRGVSAAASAAASRRLGISLAPGVDSLNAAVATGIAVALLSPLPRKPA